MHKEEFPSSFTVARTWWPRGPRRRASRQRDPTDASVQFGCLRRRTRSPWKTFVLPQRLPKRVYPVLIGHEKVPTKVGDVIGLCATTGARGEDVGMQAGRRHRCGCNRGQRCRLRGGSSSESDD